MVHVSDELSGCGHVLLAWSGCVSGENSNSIRVVWSRYLTDMEVGAFHTEKFGDVFRLVKRSLGRSSLGDSGSVLRMASES